MDVVKVKLKNGENKTYDGVTDYKHEGGKLTFVDSSGNAVELSSEDIASTSVSKAPVNESNDRETINS